MGLWLGGTCQVGGPKAYGVVEFDDQAIGIEEKPLKKNGYGSYLMNTLEESRFE